MLGFERDKGQTFGINLPDDLTISHLWRDEKKPREYNFDTVGWGKERGAVRWLPPRRLVGVW